MKPIKKPFGQKSSSEAAMCFCDIKSRSNKIHITLVLKKERALPVFPHTDMFCREPIDKTL